MRKEKSDSLQSYSKEEVEEAIMEKVNYLKSVGFDCKVNEDGYFVCKLAKKAVIIKNYWIYIYPNVRDIINLFLMDCDTEKLSRVLVAHGFVMNVSISDNWESELNLDHDWTVTEYDLIMERFAELYGKKFNNNIDADERTIQKIKKHLVEQDVEHGRRIFKEPFDSDEVKAYKAQILGCDTTTIYPESNVRKMTFKEDLESGESCRVFDVETQLPELLAEIEDKNSEVKKENESPVISVETHIEEEGISELMDVPAEQDIFILNTTLCSKCNTNRWIHTYNGQKLCTTCFTETVEKTL